MRWIKYLIASSVLLLCCNKKVTYTLYEGDPLEQTQKSSRNNKCCRDRVHYVPDALQEVKTLRVCFHYMYDSAGRHNLDKDKAKKFAKELIQSCNKVLQAAIQPNLGGDTLDALPKGYQLKIFPATDVPEDDGFYFHKDDDLYYFIAYGRNKNNYDTKVIRKYALKKDSFINIFMMPHHPDSVKSESYRVRRNGIALGTGLKVAGYYSRNLWPGEFAGLTNHEIGHTLGLSHSWNSSDGCDDTPRHKNCWNFEKEPPCDKEVSNNMMDYNVFQNALTPCQLSWIHRNLTRWSSKTRKLVVPTWCEKKDTVWIKEPTIWESEKDLSSDIIIMDGGHLTVKCRLSLPENGFIRVDPGAQLTLDNAWLHNSCNKTWQGIKVGKKGNREGSVETKGAVRIDLYPQTREKT